MTTEPPYGTLFEFDAYPGSPFACKTWALLMFAETLPRRVSPYFRPLRAIAERIGDGTALWADERDPKIKSASSWNENEFLHKSVEFPLGALLYGASGRWAAVMADQGFTVLGGEPLIVSEIAEALGGVATVRSEFDRFLASAVGLELDRDKVEGLRRLNRWEPE